ncbi:Atxe2 family lasso peptide isopeptidase [Nostoc sp. 3335mG]|nr:Atxe2 family lasso peptide isopeptidase [Nostoc sp. 3335mG]
MVSTAAILLAGLAASTVQPPTTGVSIRDIVEVTDLSGLAVSPDGKLVAFRTGRPAIDSNSYVMTWYVAPIDGSAPPRRVADGGGGQFDAAGGVTEQTPVWSPMSNAIFIRSLVDGQVQVWRAAADGSDTRAVTADAANVRDLALGSDGASLTYHVGATRDDLERAEQKADDEGVLVDKSVDIASPISRGWIVDGRRASERFTGNWFDRGDLLWQTPIQTKTIALETGDAALVRGADPVASAKSGRVKSAEIKGDGLHHSIEAKLDDGRTMTCTLPACTSGRPNAVALTTDRRAVVVTIASVTMDQSLYLWTPADQSIRPIVAATGLLSGDQENDTPCAVAQTNLICVAADATHPPALVRVALGDGKQTQLFDPNAPLRRRIGTSARRLVWRDPLGDTHGAQLILPTTPRPAPGYPLVLTYYHCPGFLRGGLGDEVPLLPLANAGIATLCINRAPSDLWHPLRDYAHAVSGIRAILDQLGAEHLIDRDRVGMTGLSFGSEVTLSVLMETHLLAAASISSVQMDPLLYWFNANPERDYAETIKRAWNLGPPDSDLASWKKYSPALNANRISAPLLMQLPESEARGSMHLVTALQNAGRPVELYAFANEPHIKNQPRHKLAVYERNLDWFRFWLQGVEDPATAKIAQYKGWHDRMVKRDRVAGRR